MSGYTPAAMSWSTARIVSTLTPLPSMISIAIRASPFVLDTPGEGLKRAVTNNARTSLKSHVLSLHNCCWYSFMVGSSRVIVG